MKWVTGHVRCQVTGRKPTLNFSRSTRPSGVGSKLPQLSQACSRVMTASQVTRQRLMVREKFMDFAPDRTVRPHSYPFGTASASEDVAESGSQSETTTGSTVVAVLAYEGVRIDGGWLGEEDVVW